jgi:hypothetical protein
MNSAEAFAAWVPDLPDDEFGPAWTHWAKPVLFATTDDGLSPTSIRNDELQQLQLAFRAIPTKFAVVVDLPGARAVSAAVQLSDMGLRPVPLFNGGSGLEELVNTGELISALRTAAERLQHMSIGSDAAPVFLLDSRRMSKDVTPAPGRFDNRWFTFPQDFPSANLLRARGISSVVLVQEKIGQPAEDLAHVLKRWQDAGIEIRCATPESAHIESLDVTRPRRFRSLWYGLLALMGLFPNSAGGFGGIIPHPSSG